MALPAKQGDFASRAFWDEFFTKDKKTSSSSAFEWYADWEDIQSLASPTLPAGGSGRALELGCGSSELSFALAKTKRFEKVTAVDFSSVVIEEMKKKQLQSYPTLPCEFVVGDFFHLPDAWTAAFDVVADKGALDALLSDSETQEGAKRGEDYMKQVARVTRDVFWCVSLLEANVLAALLDSALDFKTWKSMTIQSFLPKQSSKLCPFLVIMKRKQASDEEIFEGVKVDGADGRANPDRVRDLLERARETYKAKLALDEEKKEGIRASFWIGQNERFELTVVDAQPSVVAIPFGAMVLPLGREHEWGYRTEEGLTDLARTNGIARLIVVALGRDQDWSKSTSESLQAEVSPAVLELAPRGLLASGYTVPFLGASSSEDFGSRETLFRVDSEISGEILVERVEMPSKELYRRMIFSVAPWAVQSEVRLIHENGADRVDLTRLCFPLHQAMALAKRIVDLMSGAEASEEAPTDRAVVVGLGGGGLASYLSVSRVFGFVQGIDLDPHVLSIAREWFGLQAISSSELEMIVGDGMAFLKSLAESKARNTRAVFIDVDSKRDTAPGLLFPPFEFISPAFLCTMRDEVLVANHGVMVVNLGSRSEEARKGFFKLFKGVFRHVVLLSMSPFQDINVVVVAWGNVHHATPQDQSSLGHYFRRVKQEILLTSFDGELEDSLMWMDAEFVLHDEASVEKKWPPKPSGEDAKKQSSKNKKKKSHKKR